MNRPVEYGILLLTIGHPPGVLYNREAWQEGAVARACRDTRSPAGDALHTQMVVENPLNSSPNAFEVLECFHIAGFALAIGMIALVDFSLLGFIMLKQSPARIARAFEWWTMGGLIVAVVSGLLIFSTDPDMYYLNRSFLLKMAALALAIVYNYTIHRQALSRDLSPASTGLIACLSLLLWVSVIFGGIFIAVIPARLV